MGMRHNGDRMRSVFMVKRSATANLPQVEVHGAAVIDSNREDLETFVAADSSLVRTHSFVMDAAKPPQPQTSSARRSGARRLVRGCAWGCGGMLLVFGLLVGALILFL